jgi:hypothetical protein
MILPSKEYNVFFRAFVLPCRSLYENDIHKYSQENGVVQESK